MPLHSLHHIEPKRIPTPIIVEKQDVNEFHFPESRGGYSFSLRLNLISSRYSLLLEY